MLIRNFVRDQAGATAVTFALSMPIIMGAFAASAEIGFWYQKKSKLQNIADMAALAAAYEIKTLKQNADYEMAAKGDAFHNNLDFKDTTVTVNYPPTTSKYSNYDAVEVIIDQKQDLYFMKYFGLTNVNIKTRGLAVVLDAAPACVLSLNENASPGFSIGGSAVTDFTGCGVHANSKTSFAVEVGKKPDFTASCLGAAGGISFGPGAVLTECPQPMAYDRVIKDPYRRMTTPDVAAMTQASVSKSGGVTTVYPNGSGLARISNQITSNGEINFQSGGTYVFDGVDLKLNSTHAVLNALDATLIFMNGAMISTANGGDLNLRAPKTGDYKGLSLVFDRQTTPAQSLRINGNQGSTIEGMIYAPTLDLKYNGGANQASGCFLIIADIIEFVGNASMTNTSCDTFGAQQIGGENGSLVMR